MAAGRAEGEETQRRASSRGGEGAPEGRSLGGGAGVMQYAAAAQVPRDAVLRLAGLAG